MTDTTNIQYPVALDQCPHCHFFAWSYDDNVLITDADGELADLDMCRCDDCGHTWLVPSLPFSDVDDE